MSIVWMVVTRGGGLNMLKYVIALTLLCLILPDKVFANEPNFNLTAEHGPQLQSADFPIRYKFEKETGRKWADTTYSQREAFLTDWHKQLAVQQIKEREERLNALKAEKERLKQKNELTSQDRQQLKMKKDAKKAELKEQADEKKHFKKKSKEQKDKIKKMRQLQKQKRKNRKS